MIRPRHLIGATVLAGAFTAPGCMSQAFAAPNCGGQSAAPQPVPYTCVLPPKGITYQGVTRTFSAVVNADGTHVSVQYIMSAPLPVAVPILIDHHVGKSGDGGPESALDGVIPAGQTTATLTVTTPCVEGQLDVFAVGITIKGDTYRVGGPWIQNGAGCVDTTTTVPQSSTTTTPTASSTVPPPTSVTTSAPTSPTSAPTTSKVGGGTLPPTGSSAGPVLVGFSVLVIGLLLITAAVRRRAS